jgi:hypothetical protein
MVGRLVRPMNATEAGVVAVPKKGKECWWIQYSRRDNQNTLASIRNAILKRQVFLERKFRFSICLDSSLCMRLACRRRPRSVQ